MAGSGTPTMARGGRKSVDFTLNLVPTIDLLSVLIAFLLITAVWAQVARIQVAQRLPAGTAASAPTQSLVLRLDRGRMSLALSDAPPDAGATVLEYPENGLAAGLRAALPTFVRSRSGPLPVQILASDGVDFRTLVAALDTLADFGLTSVRVGSNAAPKSR